ncbi:hypothetical protein FB474_3358 [Oryzihumus leptocrescens]|uniref:Uncharacterized protein n=1 Tax=Oryzihumus leptocrescens TaxID=297536 RepID=A0A542ZNH1_9MICO|nr:hypothetical protein FB474_3358 [Oryzihumus leptocrescens]
MRPASLRNWAGRRLYDAGMPQAVGNRGLWEVVTQTSRYVLNLDSGTAQRIPGEGLGRTAGDWGPRSPPRGVSHGVVYPRTCTAMEDRSG